MKVVRGPVYARCPYCKKLVRMTGLGFLNGVHICDPEKKT